MLTCVRLLILNFNLVMLCLFVLFELTLSVCVWRWSCNLLHGSKGWCKWAWGCI